MHAATCLDLISSQACFLFGICYQWQANFTSTSHPSFVIFLRHCNLWCCNSLLFLWVVSISSLTALLLFLVLDTVWPTSDDEGVSVCWSAPSNASSSEVELISDITAVSNHFMCHLMFRGLLTKKVSKGLKFLSHLWSGTWHSRYMHIPLQGSTYFLVHLLEKVPELGDLLVWHL